MASKYEKFVIDHGYSPNMGRLHFECIFCGQDWFPGGGSRLPRGSFLCPNGCTKDYDEALERYNKILFRRNPVTGKYEPYRKAVEVEE